MAKINLREYYSDFYATDFIIDASDELMKQKQLPQWERNGGNYERRYYRNKVHYSLDRKNGIERRALLLSLSPCAIYERKITYEQIPAAASTLSGKQGKRIYAHYFLG